jgi:hypothetical protein
MTFPLSSCKESRKFCLSPVLEVWGWGPGNSSAHSHSSAFKDSLSSPHLVLCES